jgi:hypothetical protein
MYVNYYDRKEKLARENSTIGILLCADGKTPNNTIQERVQRDKRFTKVGFGLYALTQYLNKLPNEYNPKIKKSKEEENRITHSHIHGMLIEIGNIQGFKTFSSDKNGLFVNKKLGEMITQISFPDFTFKNIIKITRRIDVIWFNERQFPNNLFEVENSTSFVNSLSKFVELQDFNTAMTLIAPKEKRSQFQQKIELAAFASIKNRVKFYDYEYIEKLYNKQIELREFKSFFINKTR